ncbi:uncharacterized protein EDB91DRAFT_1336607 [Suillus paluster]|uniref:uncharacterized protein n=1 Tax=Suillus paluster TaxID=48578 RepID=UPI001B85B3A1|nr:uncharacterized protein EDB91DRAFT_1336607 [Suillus paluster]KAG1740193.1 hypothetical protein EDB91DRAFT_1336607 [Suillus paluster]
MSLRCKRRGISARYLQPQSYPVGVLGTTLSGRRSTLAEPPQGPDVLIMVQLALEDPSPITCAPSTQPQRCAGVFRDNLGVVGIVASSAQDSRFFAKPACAMNLHERGYTNFTVERTSSYVDKKIIVLCLELVETQGIYAVYPSQVSISVFITADVNEMIFRASSNLQSMSRTLIWNWTLDGCWHACLEKAGAPLNLPHFRIKSAKGPGEAEDTAKFVFPTVCHAVRDKEARLCRRRMGIHIAGDGTTANSTLAVLQSPPTPPQHLPTPNCIHHYLMPTLQHLATLPPPSMR